MPDHGGFAVAVTIRERVFNDAILRAYSGGTSTHRLTGPLPGGPPVVLVDFFLEPPRVRAIGVDPDLLVVELSGWGPLAINWGGINHVREVRWQLRLGVQARFVVAGNELGAEPWRRRLCCRELELRGVGWRSVSGRRRPLSIRRDLPQPASLRRLPGDPIWAPSNPTDRHQLPRHHSAIREHGHRIPSYRRLGHCRPQRCDA